MAALKKSYDEVVRLQGEDDLESYRYALSGHGAQHEAVLEVDKEDDLSSVRAKLESTPLSRAVLVIPTNAKTLREGFDFRVLRRLQRELGLDLVLVSPDMRRRALAIENGFRQVFPSVKAYYTSRNSILDRVDRTPFNDPEEFTPAPSIGANGLLIAATMAVILAIVGYFVVPLATVTVYPETQALVRDVEVLVETGGPRIDLTAQRLTARLVEQRVQVQGAINVREVAGTGQSGSTITLQVREALRDRLLRQASAQLAQQLKADLNSNESLPDKSIRTEIVGERYDRGVGDNATSLSGSLDVVASALAFNNDDFNRLVGTLWAQDVPRDHQAVGTPVLTPPAIVTAQPQHMTLRVQASGRTMPRIDLDAVANAVRGQPADEAREAIAKLGPFTRPAVIGFWPDWASRAVRVEVAAAVDPSARAIQPSR